MLRLICDTGYSFCLSFFQAMRELKSKLVDLSYLKNPSGFHPTMKELREEKRNKTNGRPT